MATPTFTYTADPANSPLDAMRLTLGDADPRDPLLYDGELAYFLAKANNNTPEACFAACGAIIAKLSRLCDETVGQVSIALSQRLRNYTALQDVLRQDLGTQVKFYCGGISRQQIRQNRSNPDLLPPQVAASQTDPPLTRVERWPWGSGRI